MGRAVRIARTGHVRAWTHEIEGFADLNPILYSIRSQKPGILMESTISVGPGIRRGNRQLEN